MPGTTHALPRSGKFIAPGQPVHPARMAAVRQTLLEGLQSLASEYDLDGYSLASPALALSECCDFAETALKELLQNLSADLIGGANVTRLDRVLCHFHPRLPYRRALRIVDGRGWHLNLGDDLPPAAQASLIRFCGLLPVQVLYMPGKPQPFARKPRTQGFCTFVPWGGRIIEAVLPQAGAECQASFSWHIDGLLRFVLGLAD